MTGRKTATYALLIPLIALSVIAVASVTLTNITEWHVQAETTPIVKRAGADVDGSLISIGSYTASDGTNRTTITIKGFKGDITHYDEALKICNIDTTHSYQVTLVYQGVLSGGWTYVEYLKLTPDGASTLTIDSSTAAGASSGTVTVAPGSCVPVSADVLVHTDASTGSDLVVLEVDVQATRV